MKDWTDRGLEMVRDLLALIPSRCQVAFYPYYGWSGGGKNISNINSLYYVNTDVCIISDTDGTQMGCR